MVRDAWVDGEMKMGDGEDRRVERQWMVRRVERVDLHAGGRRSQP